MVQAPLGRGLRGFFVQPPLGFCFSMTSPEQPRNPLHGLTLERMLTDLVDYYGWRELGERIPVRCFNLDPSVSSSLRFLRKTPWAREKVEQLYLYTLRQHQRAQR